jgi:hypothetical protein
VPCPGANELSVPLRVVVARHLRGQANRARQVHSLMRRMAIGGRRFQQQFCVLPTHAMTHTRASHVQSATDGGYVSSDSFAARAQSAAIETRAS